MLSRFFTMSILTCVALGMFLLLGSIAYAQDTPPINLDPATIFGSVAGLAFAATGLVAWLRQSYLQQIDGPLPVALFTVGVAIALAIAGYFLGYLPDTTTFVDAMKFGATAGASAVLGVTILDRLAKKRSNPELGASDN